MELKLFFFINATDMSPLWGCDDFPFNLAIGYWLFQKCKICSLTIRFAPKSPAGDFNCFFY